MSDAQLVVETGAEDDTMMPTTPLKRGRGGTPLKSCLRRRSPRLLARRGAAAAVDASDDSWSAAAASSGADGRRSASSTDSGGSEAHSKGSKRQRVKTVRPRHDPNSAVAFLVASSSVESIGSEGGSGSSPSAAAAATAAVVAPTPVTPVPAQGSTVPASAPLWTNCPCIVIRQLLASSAIKFVTAKFVITPGMRCVTLGRTLTCQVIITWPCVSRQHAQIDVDWVSKTSARVQITNLQSQLGVFVDGVKTKSSVLENGATVTIAAMPHAKLGDRVDEDSARVVFTIDKGTAEDVQAAQQGSENGSGSGQRSVQGRGKGASSSTSSAFGSGSRGAGAGAGAGAGVSRAAIPAGGAAAATSSSAPPSAAARRAKLPLTPAATKLFAKLPVLATTWKRAQVLQAVDALVPEPLPAKDRKIIEDMNIGGGSLRSLQLDDLEKRHVSFGGSRDVMQAIKVILYHRGNSKRLGASRLAHA